MMCIQPIADSVLADYWTAALPESEQNTAEEHLLSCDGCTARLESIAGLADGIRKLARQGALSVIISREFLDRRCQENLRVREYNQTPGGSVACTVTAQDDLLIAHLAADLRGATRIDLVQSDSSGRELDRLTDIPFNPALGEVILSENVGWVRTLPSQVMKLQMISVEARSQRVLAEYTFNHTAAQ
jgi:hypothetical protein